MSTSTLLSEEEQQEFIDELSENGVNINELSDEELTEFGETEIPLETLIEAYLSEDEQTALSELDDEDFDGLMELDENALNELSALSHEEMEIQLAGAQSPTTNAAIGAFMGGPGGAVAGAGAKTKKGAAGRGLAAGAVVGAAALLGRLAIKGLAKQKGVSLSEDENMEENMDVTELSERLQTLEAENAFYRWHE